ncbi:dynamin family protein [Sediminibacillus massiliensis]|uniref:dynamin family protein n=1 Tax=Sediminibacillus massiliensis TaxID=1926277 RepID=UPI000988821D|nr:dynamin family protein [Sediminibacillus massiliensis]
MSEATKVSLYKDIQAALAEWGEIAPASPQLEKLEELKQDIEADYFTLVTVGEFKNGKSTFLNALLEEELLPVNVTPTTAAIHMLYQGTNRQMEVVKADGEKEYLPLVSKSLEKFTAQAEFDPDTVKYIKVPHPSRMLGNRVVLVDTPGVNDLNTHRVAVTHQFIPRADGILFLVDITAPFRKSEMEFLEDYLLHNGIENILFIANFIDLLDDEDAIDEVLEFANRRLSKVTGRKQHNILPLSALEALEGTLQNDEETYELSGMEQIRQSVEELILNGTKQQEKVDRYQYRFQLLKNEMNREIEQEKTFASQTVDKLQAEKRQLQQLTEGKEDWNNQLHDYIDERTAEINFMIIKSMDHFEQQLKTELAEAIDYHTGDNIKTFVERDLSRKIKNELTKWVDHHSQSIYTLFRMLEVEISKGLTATFQQNSELQTVKDSVTFSAAIDMDSPDSSNTAITSGALLGGASALALALGAGVLFPIVAFVGQPWLSNKLKERKWEKVKPTIIEETDNHVSMIFIDFRQHMNAYVQETIRKIQQGSSEEFNRMVSHYETSIDQKIKAKQQSERDQAERLDRLVQFQEKWMQSKEIQPV